MTLQEACGNILNNNMFLKREEKLLIIKDHTKYEIADAFEAAGKNLCGNIKVVEIPLLEFNGMEPPAEAAAAMLQADVIMVTTSRSLSWTNARTNATRNGARLASMARVTEDMLIRAAQTDYFKVRDRVRVFADLLDKSSLVKITTEAGTDIAMSIEGRKAHGRNSGIFNEPGNWGNIPCGEAFIAPVEGTANGIYVVDGTQTGLGLLEEPITFKVKDGFVTEISGGAQADEFRKMLEAVNDKNAFSIAELGIGANDKAKLCGITLEDEKVLGTCHIALGRNDLFGGIVNVGVHVDGVIKSPNIYFDGELVIESGKLKKT